MYNQLLQKQTWYACSVYALLNQIKYDYGVVVPLDTILTTLTYLEKIGAFFPTQWASASVIYPAIQKYISWKLGLVFKIETSTISQMDIDKGYILGFKKAIKLYTELTKDWELTIADLDKIALLSKSQGHFHFLKRWVLIETLWGYEYKVSKDTLLYGLKKDLYYPTVRRFVPATPKTVEVCLKSMTIVKNRRDAWWKNPFISLQELKDLFLSK